MKDPCDRPDGIEFDEDLEDQVYTITQAPVEYQIPAFEGDPDWCSIKYSYTISSPEAESAISFNSETRVFTFSLEDDVSPSGSDSEEYTITVIAEIGNIPAHSETDS